MPKIPVGKVRWEIHTSQETRDAIREIAEAERRPINAQLEIIIEAALAEYRAKAQAA